MNSRDPKLLALLFNERINQRDTEGLRSLMSPDHVFADSEGDEEVGREITLEVWKEFFRRWPDYRNTITRVASRDDRVVAEGHASCSHVPLHGPSLWAATVRGDLVTEWRVYEDNPANRQQLGLP